MTLLKILESYFSNLKSFLNKNVSLENREVLKKINDSDIANWNKAKDQLQYPVTVTTVDDVDIGNDENLLIPAIVILQKLSDTKCNLLIRGRVAKNEIPSPGTWYPINMEVIRNSVGLNTLEFDEDYSDFQYAPMTETLYAEGHSVGAWYINRRGAIGRYYDYSIFTNGSTSKGWSPYQTYGATHFLQVGMWIRIQIFGATYS